MDRAPPATAGWRVVLAIAVAGVCWLAFDPTPPPQTDTGWDKANHVLAFLVVTFLSRCAFPGVRLRTVAAAGLAFGAFIEVVQYFVPGRSSEWADLAADAVGIALVLLPIWWRRRA